MKSCDSAQLVFCENVFVKDVFWCLALVCTLSDPCQNNATCIEIGDGVNVNCSCLDGYTDPLCQTGAFGPRNVTLNANCYMWSVFHIFGRFLAVLWEFNLLLGGFRFSVCFGQPVSKWRHVCWSWRNQCGLHMRRGVHWQCMWNWYDFPAVSLQCTVPVDITFKFIVWWFRKEQCL